MSEKLYKFLEVLCYTSIATYACALLLGGVSAFVWMVFPEAVPTAVPLFFLKVMVVGVIGWGIGLGSFAVCGRIERRHSHQESAGVR